MINNDKEYLDDVLFKIKKNYKIRTGYRVENGCHYLLIFDFEKLSFSMSISLSLGDMEYYRCTIGLYNYLEEKIKYELLKFIKREV